jgi:hypothetical protein
VQMHGSCLSKISIYDFGAVFRLGQSAKNCKIPWWGVDNDFGTTKQQGPNPNRASYCCSQERKLLLQGVTPDVFSRL